MRKNVVILQREFVVVLFSALLVAEPLMVNATRSLPIVGYFRLLLPTLKKDANGMREGRVLSGIRPSCLSDKAVIDEYCGIEIKKDAKIYRSASFEEKCRKTCIYQKKVVSLHRI